MNKSVLNTAISITMSTLLVTCVINSEAIASTIDRKMPDDTASYSDTGIGMGFGAVAGTVIAGPVGLMIGGIVGAYAGASQTDSETEDQTADSHEIEFTKTSENTDFTPKAEITDKTEYKNSLLVAQSDEIEPVSDDINNITQKDLLDTLVTDLSLDIYFRSGSTDIEKFYPARLNAIAELLKNMSTLEVQLDGYTDRLGDKDQNIALANKRIDRVRHELIDAGVDEHRIVSKAFGEVNTVSAAGDLDAYTFDRKVVISFKRIDADSIYSMNNILSEDVDNELATKDFHGDGTLDNNSISPAIAETSNRF